MGLIDNAVSYLLRPQVVEHQNPGMDFGPFSTPRTDASVDKAIDKIEGRYGHLGEWDREISGRDMLNVFRAARDYGQITQQEWNQIKDWVSKNYDRLSPEAEAMFSEMDAHIQRNGQGQLHGPHDPVIDGRQLAAMMGHMEQLSRPPVEFMSHPLYRVADGFDID
jgi:hypothetical protein